MRDNKTHISLHFNLVGTRMSPFWILLELRLMKVVSGDNWSYKMHKAAVKSSLPTNQRPVFYRLDAIPVTQPTVTNHRGVSTFTGTLR